MHEDVTDQSAYLFLFVHDFVLQNITNRRNQWKQINLLIIQSRLVFQLVVGNFAAQLGLSLCLLQTIINAIIFIIAFTQYWLISLENVEFCLI